MKSILELTRFVGIASLLAACGCSSIHSTAVRQLIEREGNKIADAGETAKRFSKETATRVKYLKDAEARLSDEMAIVQASEHVHTLVFSASQNLETKKGIDAQAAAYLIASTYLAKQAGLDQQVRDQFAEDYAALAVQARRIEESWGSLQKLHQQVQAYAKKSALASVDAQFLAALVEQTPHGSEYMETVLKNSRKLNDALEKGLREVPGHNGFVEQSQSYLSDLMNLLERVKASK